MDSVLKYILNIELLQAGDIILDRDDNDRDCRVVRARTGDEYYHARLYVGNESIIESNWLGVQAINPLRIIYNNPDDAVIMRCPEITDDMICSICSYARNEIGKEYGDMSNASSKPYPVKNPNRQFCTRFVAKAYSNAGVPIVNNPDYCTAGEIQKSGRLSQINDILLPISIQETKMFIEDGFLVYTDKKTIQTEVIYSCLEKIRNFLTNKDVPNDIQTFDQLIAFNNADKTYDKELAQILIQSDYYSLWKQYKESNPWEFDVKKFIDKYGPDSGTQAEIMKHNTYPSYNRWRAELIKFLSLNSNCKTELNAAFIALYGELINMSKRRLDTAETILNPLLLASELGLIR